MALYWYGERGIVNALVVGLNNSADTVSATIAVLQGVVWGDFNAKKWLVEIKSVNFIVEIGLNSFGDPDLIIVCTTCDETKHAFFIEAKAKTYLESVENDGASRIHRQLTLKYRFAMALSTWDGDVTHPIIESPLQHTAYFPSSEDASVVELNHNRRIIAKRSVLKILRDAGLGEVRAENMYFVAWTWDSTPFFDQSDFCTSPARPMFLNDQGNEVLNERLGWLGWLGYQQIINCDQLAHLHDEFRLSLSSMKHFPQPLLEAKEEIGGLKRLRLRSLEEFRDDNELFAQYQRLKDAAESLFGSGQTIEHKSGLSVSLRRLEADKCKVLIKIVPQKDGARNHLLLGVSTIFRQRTWAEKNFTLPATLIGGRSSQPFFTYLLPVSDSGTNFAISVFDEVASLVNQDVEEGA